MRKWVILSVLAAAGTLLPANRASAYGYGLHVHPYYQSAAFPCINPPGYYTNVYYFPWYYPWFAYYNYSHGPYANWWKWGGYATYGGNCGPNGCGYAAYAPVTAPAAESGEATLCVALPADARLLFNGTPADGTGETRTFRTPPLAPGREYAYELTAEVVREGRVQTVTERVVVRPGQETKVTLTPGAVRTAGK